MLARFNPARAIDRPRIEAYEGSKAGNAADIRAQIRKIPDDLAGLRDKALVLCYLLTGRRLQEIVALRWGDMEPNGATAVLRIARVKGGETARTELPAEAWTAVQAYLLADGRARGLAPTAAVFTRLQGQAGAPLSRQAVWQIIRDRLGLHPHQLRHTYAQQLWALGADVCEIQALLGHKHLATTQRYLGKLELPRNPYAGELAGVFLGGGKRRKRAA